jgi:hypothetical protein
LIKIQNSYTIFFIAPVKNLRELSFPPFWILLEICTSSRVKYKRLKCEEFHGRHSLFYVTSPRSGSPLLSCLVMEFLTPGPDDGYATGVMASHHRRKFSSRRDPVYTHIYAQPTLLLGSYTVRSRVSPNFEFENRVTFYIHMYNLM